MNFGTRILHGAEVKFRFQPNLVPNLTFGAEVHSFAQVTPVPK